MDPSGCIVHYEYISITGKLRKVTTTTLKTEEKQSSMYSSWWGQLASVAIKCYPRNT